MAQWRKPVAKGAFIHSDRWSGGMESFKPMGFHPVKGGRWKIRRRWKPTETGRIWNARTDGKARRWNKVFYTHGEAIRWAQYVSHLYWLHGKEVADVIIKENLRSWDPK